jgi:ABC-type branched-subunit amino acid transport system substrate-binding protein/tetratricopeptide (TPR) repeat protein
MGMNRLRNAVMWALLLCISGIAHAQSLKPDEKARELISLARQEFALKSYADAGQHFEVAAQRPEHDLSSYAYYMAGLSYFHQGDLAKADVAFSTLVKAYPKSKYVEEAKYHQAFRFLDSPNRLDQEKALDMLFKILNETSNRGLRADADNTLRHYAFNKLDAALLRDYRAFVTKEQELMLVEAYCCRLDKKSDAPRLMAELKAYQDKGGQLSPYLQGLKSKYESTRVASSDRLNIAIFLSFQTEGADSMSIVPAKGLAAVEMYEGMMLALDSIGPRLGKEINISTFDTRGDTIRVRRQLDSLAKFGPDIILGDIRTSIATQISAWAEKNKVVHIIPRNPLNDLVSNKKYTFLAHPSLGSHGREMANYLVQSAGLKSFVVFNDKTFYSEKMSSAFIEAAKRAGATVSEKVISKESGKVKGEASIEAKNIKNNGTQGVYVPISNEESAGMIISYLNYHSAKPVLAGGPDWEAFNVIDGELKSSFQLKYSTLYHDKNDSTAFERFSESYFGRFSTEPTMNAVMGYDIMAWLLEVGKTVGPQNDPVTAIHKAPAYHGIHQDVYFGDAQDNQRLNIVQFDRGRINKVNGNQP